MRVALSFPGCHRRGGVERIMLECANFLQKRGHDTHVLSTDWETGALHTGITRHTVASFKRPPIIRFISFAVQSRRTLRTLNPPADVLSAFGVLSPTDGVLWMQSVHRAWLEISRSQRDFQGRVRQRLNPIHPLALAMEKHYVGRRKYRKLIALTDAVKADLIRYYRVPDEDVVVVPNGFSPDEFNLEGSLENRAAMRRQLGYAESDRVVVFVANELERKGFPALLRAIAGLNDSRIHLLMVGRVQPGSYLQEIQRLGLQERVKFAGPTNRVADYYAASDLFALPTLYEAWGLVIVEAMACGLPVVTSRLAGASIAVCHRRTGWLLDAPQNPAEVSEGLRTFLDHTPLSRHEIAASVADYAWERVLPKYERLLMECSSQPRR